MTRASPKSALKRVLALPLVLGLAGLSAGIALAKTDTIDKTAVLKADRIVYTSGRQVLRASGNVVITFGGMILTARGLTFDESTNIITADGPLRLRDGDKVTIVAEFARLSGDLREGILKSARMVLNRQMQLTAVEISRSKGRYTQLYRAAASTCTISNARQTPFWQIRARRIVHDDKKKVLFFERAQLRLGGVPVAYLPRLKVPDPSVKRASGFLVPGISTSDTLGTGITAPYFMTLGKYADVTLTPTIYSTGSATLGYDFRKRFHRGDITLTGAISNDTRAAYHLRGYLFAKGKWRFSGGMLAKADLQFTSDRTYLSDHNFSSVTRLENRISLGRSAADSRFDAQILGYRTLSTSVAGDTIPYLLGDIGYRHRLAAPVLGGELALGLALGSYTRRASTNITGRDGMSMTAGLDWRRQWISAGGLVFGTTAKVDGSYYNIRQDSTYPAPLSRVVPVAAADFRLPMTRQTGRATEVIEPRLQLVYSPGSNVAVPNEDSQLVEFDTGNLFTLNRFSGRDANEKGLRANAGITYRRRANNGAAFELMLGKVLRLSDQGQFSAASGLQGASSGYILGTRITLPTHLRMVNRMVIGNNRAVLRTETRLAYKTKRFDIDTSYLWLLKGAAGNTAANVSDWSVKTGWNFGNNWRSEASWRYDLAGATASNAGLGITYRNDCIKVDLSLSRQFASSSNIGASTSLGLQVTLDGFGARANSDAFARRCGDF